jgi:hypothetical protein
MLTARSAVDTAFTVMVLLPAIESRVAEMVVVPAVKAVAWPPAETVATEVFDDAQATEVDRSAVVPSE